MTEPESSPQNPLVRLLIEIGPLAAFFIANARAGIITATAVFMVAIVLALIAAWVRERRLPVLPLVTAAFVLVFGGLTLLLDDELFIMLKPTIVNVCFAAILIGGLCFGRSFLKSVLGSSLELDDVGWRILTFRWALFFLALAALNEIVRRNFPGAWVNFKVFGIMPLTLLFTFSQMGLIQRHMLKQEEV